MPEIIKNATIGNRLFVFLVCVSVGAFVASWLMPPTGVVDSSTLSGMGWLFALACLDTVRDAIHRGIDAKLTKGDTSIELNNPDTPRTSCPTRSEVGEKIDEIL